MQKHEAIATAHPAGLQAKRRQRFVTLMKPSLYFVSGFLGRVPGAGGALSAQRGGVFCGERNRGDHRSGGGDATGVAERERRFDSAIDGGGFRERPLEIAMAERDGRAIRQLDGRRENNRIDNDEPDDYERDVQR